MRARPTIIQRLRHRLNLADSKLKDSRLRHSTACSSTRSTADCNQYQADVDLPGIGCSLQSIESSF